MARRGGPVRDRAEYFLFRAFLGVVRILPPGVSLAFARGLGRLAHMLFWRRRRAAARNVELALHVPRAEAARIVRGSFQTLILNMTESALLGRHLETVPLDEVVAIEGAEHLERVLDAGSGVLLAMAHLGAWEAMGPIISRRFRPFWAVGRPLDNPLIGRVVDELRGHALAGTLEKEGSGLRLARLFRSGEIVALLLDQNAGRQGVMLDFFERPAMQHKVSGVMSRRFEVPVVPAYLLRESGSLRFRLVFEEPLRADADLPEDEAILDVVRRVARSLENRIRETPDQWLWLHDRWRRARFMLDRQARREQQASKVIRPTLAEGTNGG